MKLRKPFWAIKWKDRMFDAMDLNRELIAPSTNIWHLEGGVCINCDDDFWACAIVPWSWRHLTCQEIAEKLWPEIKGDATVSYKPDSGDAWWDAYWADDDARVKTSIRAFDGPTMPGMEVTP